MVQPISPTEKILVGLSQRVHLLTQRPCPVTSAAARSGAFFRAAACLAQIALLLARRDRVERQNASTLVEHLATFFTPLAACLTQTHALDRKCNLVCDSSLQKMRFPLHSCIFSSKPFYRPRSHFNLTKYIRRRVLLPFPRGAV